MAETFGQAAGKNVARRLEDFPEDIRPLVRFVNPEWLFIILQVLQMRGGDRATLFERYQGISSAEIEGLLHHLQSEPLSRYLVTTPETVAEEEGEWPIQQRVIALLQEIESIPAEMVYLIGSIAYNKGHAGRTSYSAYENDWIPRDISYCLSRFVFGLWPESVNLEVLVQYLRLFYSTDELKTIMAEGDYYGEVKRRYDQLIAMFSDES